MGGGKVVKNAAGFDFPKLMVGSLGRLGAIAEVTMKVFPEPKGVSHLRLRCSNLLAAIAMLNDLANHPWDLDALELVAATHELKIRLRGEPEALEGRRQRIGADIDEAGTLFWDERDSLVLGKPGDYLVKIPITPGRIGAVAEKFRDCLISIGGNVAWVATGDLDEIEWPALIVRGRSGEASIRTRPAAALHAAIKQAFDPQQRFQPAVMA
jgi:glycolate oxidase FAD binding subunit